MDIFYTDYHRPKQFIHAKDYLKKYYSETKEVTLASIDDFCKKSGLDRIFQETSTSETDIFVNMIQNFLSVTNINPLNVKSIFYSNLYGVSSWETKISIPHLIQTKFGMINAMVYTYEQECIGAYAGIKLSKAILDSENDISLILSSNICKNEKDRYSEFTLGGDSVGLIAINKKGKFSIIDIELKTTGTLSLANYEQKNEISNRLNTVKSGASLIKELVARNCLDFTDIKKIIPQNINKYAYKEIYSKLLSLDSCKFFLNKIGDGGHLGDVDLARNITDISTECPLNKNDHILTYGLGGSDSYMSWASMLLRLNQ